MPTERLLLVGGPRHGQSFSILSRHTTLRLPVEAPVEAIEEEVVPRGWLLAKYVRKTVALGDGQCVDVLVFQGMLEQES